VRLHNRGEEKEENKTRKNQKSSNKKKRAEGKPSPTLTPEPSHFSNEMGVNSYGPREGFEFNYIETSKGGDKQTSSKKTIKFPKKATRDRKLVLVKTEKKKKSEGSGPPGK